MNSDYRLGDCLIRPRLDRIERGDAVLHLKPKAMAVLDRLAQADGDVVTREELFDSVWPGAIVSDATLTQCVVELRQALGDSARASRYIETIPKVGFRLVAPLEPVAPGETATNGSSRPGRRPPVSVFLLVAGLLVVVLAVGYVRLGNGPVQDDPHPKSVAVLPFIDTSSARDQGWFADGLAAEMIVRLAAVPELRVTGQTSSFRFRDPEAGAQRIARQLGVRYLLGGSVQRANERIRVTAELVEAESGFTLWSEAFDRPYADLFEVQGEIAESVLIALSVTLSVGRMANVSGGTNNVQAFEAYQRARQHFAHAPGLHLEGIELLEQAVALDPGFSRAWVALSTFYNYSPMVLADSVPVDWQERSLEALEEAQRLTPDLPIVLAATIDLHQTNRRWADAEYAIARADPEILDLHPTVLFSRGVNLMKVGRCAEALGLLERARLLDPLRPDIASQLAHAYLLNGRVEEAVKESERAWELEPSPNPVFAMIGLESALGRRDSVAVRRWLERVLSRSTGGWHASFSLVRATLGDEIALRAALRNAFKQDDGSSGGDYWIANWAAYAGDTRLALDALSRSPDSYNLWSPLMADVRRQPGFIEVLDGLHLVDYWREFGWPDRCRPRGEDGVICD